MFFKRSLQRYGRTPELETPYQRAGQLWDDRIGSARVQARNWRLMSLGSLALSTSLAAGLIWVSMQSRVTPYVVAVDRLGQPQALSEAQTDYQPTDPQVAWHLAHFIGNIRSVGLDAVVTRERWLEAYDFATPRGAQFIGDYARSTDPFGDIGNKTVSVQVTSVVRASDRSFQVKWTETAFERGNQTGTSRWTAILTVVTKTPRTAETLRKNPLGIYIDAIDWSREFETPPSPASPPPAPTPPPVTAEPAPPATPLVNPYHPILSGERSMKSIRMIAPCLLAILPMAALAQTQTIPLPAKPAPPIPLAKAGPSRPPVVAKQPRKVAHSARKRQHAVSPPLRRVAVANREATAEPATQAFINANQVYSWSEGAVYQAYAAPGSVTDIALQAGEALVAVAAGDTVRWIIGDTTSGSGADKRTHILVKPASAGLSTNLVITTDRRSYHLRFASTEKTAMVALSWNYPQDALIALRRDAARVEAATPVASGLAIDSMRFDYLIKGDRPAWRPIRAFDDGRQTFIEFPASLAVGEAPPLFVVGREGTAELVNYRVRGRFYVVDRLFDAAELRLGLKKQDIVRIERSTAGPTARQRRAS